MRSTPVLSRSDYLQRRKWYIVDANGLILGRVASAVASVLRGKHRPEFVPFEDAGDFVVIINAGKIRLSGKKWAEKRFIRHTGYPGGIRVRTATEQRVKHPAVILKEAIAGMLPKNRLGRQLLTKVKIYPSENHPHRAQQPVALTLSRDGRVLVNAES